MCKLKLHYKWFALSFLSLWLAACMGCAHQVKATSDVAANSPPPARPTTQPANVQSLRLSDAVDLEQLTKESKANLTQQLNLSRGGHIYFGELDTYDDDDNVTSSVPILAKRVHGNWKALPIIDPRLKNANWAYVGAGPHHGEVWGVLDASLDDNQPDLVLAHSTDGGATYSLSSLHKPDEVASFDSFCIGPDDQGRITVYVDAGDDAQHAKPGYYTYRTNDGGKSWSTKPDYEPDAMTPAKDVPDEDQPDAGDKMSNSVSRKV